MSSRTKAGPGTCFRNSVRPLRREKGSRHNGLSGDDHQAKNNRFKFNRRILDIVKSPGHLCSIGYMVTLSYRNTILWQKATDIAEKWDDIFSRKSGQMQAFPRINFITLKPFLNVPRIHGLIAF